ncbi:ATP-binding cassette domain-containing protein [Pedobacter aquatilis]|uniref:ABC transporter ATP-binding protein n=1 Tax=Pedobacter aquatilis TaxID=351343 RepID=UPI002931849D|nr:ATP-binding cassette domain-containing protein [Pedobacter aquatilis]
MQFVLEAVGLSKDYGQNNGLKSLDLQLKKGEIFSLLGPNGAGKSTTINLFLGFIKPTAGQAYIYDINVEQDAVLSKKYLAYIPENVTLYQNLTGKENLSLLSSLAGFNYNSETLEKLLIEAGLQADAMSRPVGSYSKGMRQKVGIAAAVAREARVLLLDEPTSGLDPKASNEFSELLKKQSENGTTIFMATHDIFRATEISNRIGIMKSGKLIDVLDHSSLSANEIELLYLDYMRN